MVTLPKLLYHGSSFKTTLLQPAFNITGVEVTWDQTESNRFLYATEDRGLAIEMGLASALEKKWLVNRFVTEDNTVTIELDAKSPLLTVAMMRLLIVYLYSIQPTSKENWVPVNNAHNRADSEWKTESSISVRRPVKAILMFEWLQERRVIIKHPRMGR